MLKSKKIYNDIYHTTFVFVYSDSYKEVLDKYNLKWNKFGGCTYFHGKIFIVLSPDAPLDVLVHECDHAIDELWKVLQIKKLKGCDECHAYMLAWIFRECRTVRKKFNKNII